MPRNPPLRRRQRTAAYGLLLEQDQVLLVRASSAVGEPGRWWLPGGGIDFGERPTDCVVREFQEETGLSVEPVGLLDVVAEVTDVPERGEQIHTVRVLYRVRALGGELRPEQAGTTDAASWHPLDDALDLPLMAFVRTVLTEL